jgi:hypothetical protein
LPSHQSKSRELVGAAFLRHRADPRTSHGKPPFHAAVAASRDCRRCDTLPSIRRLGVRPDDPSLAVPDGSTCNRLVTSFIDDTQPGWRCLTADDFAKGNGADDTWSWRDGVMHCTGQPVSVLRKCPRAAVRLPSRSIGLSGESATSWRREPLRFHQGFLPLGGT